VCKVFKGKDLGLDLPEDVCELNAKTRLLAGPSFSIYLYFNESGITKMPDWVEIFLSGKPFFLCRFRSGIWKFRGFGVLTCDFWAENALRPRSLEIPRVNGKRNSFDRCQLGRCVFEFGVPVGSAAFGGEVEECPEWVDLGECAAARKELSELDGNGVSY
jgi:hypothetical protein